MAYLHKNLANGKWHKMSLPEQLANIGSEVHRAFLWQNKDKENFESAINRALELFDLTLYDKRWGKRKREIVRIKEVFCDAISGGREYQSNLKDLEIYFYNFAFLIRNRLTV